MEINECHKAIMDYFKYHIHANNKSNTIYKGRRWHKASIRNIEDSTIYTSSTIKRYLDDLINKEIILKILFVKKGTHSSSKKFGNKIYHYAFADSSNLL